MSEPTVHETNRSFYDRISGAYDFIADANERAARQTGVKALAVRPGESIVEIGFGTGNEIKDLADLVGSTGVIAGIDVSEGMRNVAMKKLVPPPEAKIDLRVGDARELPFGDATFDAAYSSFTLELFPETDIPVVLREVMRVLKPGGRFANVSMATVKDGDRATFLEKTYVWMHRHFPHIVDCRPIDVEAVIADAGFDVAQVIEMTIWSMPVRAVVGVKRA